MLNGKSSEAKWHLIPLLKTYSWTLDFLFFQGKNRGGAKLSSRALGIIFNALLQKHR